MRGKATDRRAEVYSQHGLAPSHGKVAITHWSQACFDVVARVEDCWPLRRLGAVVVGGLSPAWHLFTCLESRSLPSQRSKARVSQNAKTPFAVNLPSRELVSTVLTFVRAVPGV